MPASGLILVAFLSAAAAAPEALWLDVPFVHQEENGCGSASVAMIIGYWQTQGAFAAHAPPDAARIQRELYVPAQKGIPAESLRRYLEAEGFTAIAIRGEWEDLAHHLARGRPLIVALKTPGGTLHYAVAAGISGSSIALNDPADRKLRKYDRAQFEKQWRAAGRWTLLAVPGGQ
jgi:predicted double-glycine peptidase